MKILETLSLVLTLAGPSLCQTNWEEYYPLHVGDFWEFQEVANSIPITVTEEVIGDTTFSNGQSYRIVKFMQHDGPFPYASYYFVRVNNLGEVWSYSFVSQCDENLTYRLSASVGDTIRDRCDSSSIVYRQLVQKDPAIVFGDTTEVQKWYSVNSPNFYQVSLAGKFGKISEQGEGWQRSLRGAIINGIQYGEITVSVPSILRDNPSGFALFQNFPNPFNSAITIAFELSDDTPIELAVYDLLGRRIRVLLEGKQMIGSYLVRWDAKDASGADLPSSVYVVVLRTLRGTYSSKVVHLK